MASNQSSNAPSSAVGVDASHDRVRGLDSIRFVCAFFVALGHIGLLSISPHAAGETLLSRLAVGLNNSVFVAQAAVIVFFIVSGFCIHFPYKEKRNPSLASFYVRRFLRIIPPAFVCFLVLRKTEPNFSLNNSILWSIVCESIYYLIYPVLLYIRRRSSWMTLILVAYATAAILLITHRGSLVYGAGYMVLGWSTWIIGLPCWLLGCWLAETYRRFRAPSVTSIWAMRFGIYTFAVLLRILRFHVLSVFMSNCVLLDLFAVPACLWVGHEIAYSRRRQPSRTLEWAGAWSYSLYLVHSEINPILSAVGLKGIVEDQRTHFLLIFIALLASYLFFRLIERPSHWLALTLGRYAKGKKETRLPAHS